MRRPSGRLFKMGQEYEIVGDGKVVGSQSGLPKSDTMIMLPYDTDLKLGDILVGKVSREEFVVRRIKPAVAGSAALYTEVYNQSEGKAPMRQDQDWTDPMQVCENGHIITWFSQSQPTSQKKRCPHCGAATILECSACRHTIPGHRHIYGVLHVDEGPPPSFCEECGKPFPWAKESKTESPLGTTSVRTVLFLAANPKGTARLRLDEEAKKIEQGLERAKKRDQFKLVQKWAVTDDDLRRALLDNEPEIIHFSGHGSGEDGLAFEDDIGRAQLISADSLARLFELCADSREMRRP